MGPIKLKSMMTCSRICCLTVLSVLLLSCSGKVTVKEMDGNDGYPVANFALTANASCDGDFFGKILQNSGKLGEWLQDRGSVSVSIRKDGKQYMFSGMNTPALPCLH